LENNDFSPVLANPNQPKSPEVPTQAAMAGLEERLRYAVERQRNEGRCDQDTAIVAINAVITFLNSIESFKHRDLALPFRALGTAVNELERGITLPLLQAARRRGKPPSSLPEQIVRVAAAAGIDTLVHLGMTDREAAKKVARRLQDSGRLLGTLDGEPIDAAARVRRWYLDMTSKKSPAPGSDAFWFRYLVFEAEPFVLRLLGSVELGTISRATAYSRALADIDEHLKSIDLLS
jgi:hypothetical protein